MPHGIIAMEPGTAHAAGSFSGSRDHRMDLTDFTFCVLLLTSACAPLCAQPPMLEESDAAELVGAPVQSAEGFGVGEVSAVTLRGDGEVTEIRMTMEQALGMGERIVVLPPNTYLVLRGTVILQLPLDEIRQLPTLQEKGKL
jgi:hypothetical protein